MQLYTSGKKMTRVIGSEQVKISTYQMCWLHVWFQLFIYWHTDTKMRDANVLKIVKSLIKQRKVERDSWRIKLRHDPVLILLHETVSVYKREVPGTAQLCVWDCGLLCNTVC